MITFKTVEEIEFWKQVYCAHVSGPGTERASIVADRAVERFRERYADSPNLAEDDILGIHRGEK